MVAIAVRGLRKVYGDVVAVDDVSFDVEEGEVLAILGPNGAGKTTTVEILEGHRRRTAGEVSVLGADPETGGRSFRERIGIVLQDCGVEEEMTVDEVLRLYRGVYPRRRDLDAVVDLVGLPEKRHARVGTLSGGQRRRLDLALGLVGDPELLFLDEPTTGFDPSARRRAWELVEALRGQGTTVLLTTHYLDEAEHLADRVAVLVDGRLVALGTPGELGAAHRDAIVTFRLPDGAAPPRLDGVVERVGLDWRWTTPSPTAGLRDLTTWALDQGVEVASLSVRRPTLEDVYLDLVGDRAAREVGAGT